MAPHHYTITDGQRVALQHSGEPKAQSSAVAGTLAELVDGVAGIDDNTAPRYMTVDACGDHARETHVEDVTHVRPETRQKSEKLPNRKHLIGCAIGQLHVELVTEPLFERTGSDAHRARGAAVDKESDDSFFRHA